MIHVKRAEAWDYALQRAFEKGIQSRTEALVEGTPTDFPAYQYIRGQIDGIQFALNTLFDVRKRLDDDGGLQEDS